MRADDIFSDPEADKELRDRDGKQKKRVTQVEHEKYVQERLFEAGVKLEEMFSRIPEPGNNCNYTQILAWMDNFTSRAMDVVRSLSVVPSSKDISTFCASGEFRGLRETDGVGLFVSFLINAFHKDAQPLVLDLRSAPLIDSLAYKLGKDVTIRGNLGDYAAMLMEAGHLTVEGKCGDNVGMYMKGGVVDVRGTIGHVGLIRYGGRIIHRGETMESDSVYKHNLIALLGVHQHDHRLARLYRELSSRELVYLDPQLKDMLHPALLEPVCEHNHEIYQQRESEYTRQAESLLARAEALEKEFRDKKLQNKGLYLGESLLAIGVTAAVPILGIFTIPYLAFRGKNLWDKEDRVANEEEWAVKGVEAELKRIEIQVDENNRSAINNLEFYLGLPGVKNYEMRHQLSTAKATLGIR